MGINGMMRYKGLTFATLGLVIGFIVYLVLNTVLQSAAQKDLKYATSVNQVLAQISSDMSDSESKRIALILEGVKSGKGVLINGKPIDSQSLSEFLSPNPSSLGLLLENLSAGDLTAAVKSASNVSSSISRRLDKKLKLSTYLQVAAAIIAVLIYLLAIVPLIGRLSTDQETDVQAVDETKGIMSTVSEGLFLLDHEYQIGLEQSASLKEIFKLERDLEGDFFDFIEQYAAPNIVQTTREFLGLLYGDRVKEKLIKDLNPLNEVEINLVRKDGRYESRYLDFSFSRVMEGDTLKQLLVSVTDETRRVLLERELVETKEEQEAQMELLFRILHVERSQLLAFFATAEKGLLNVNTVLEARGHGDGEIRSKVSDISRTIHQLKGDAAALGLHNFEFIAHALEEELVAVKSIPQPVSGKALLPALTKLKDLFLDLEQMQALSDKLGQGVTKDMFASDVVPSSNDGQDDTAPTESTNSLATTLHNLSDTVSKRNGKRAHISTYGLNLSDLPETLQESFPSIAVQLVRNSIVHGALTPELRVSSGKSDFINISVSLNETEDSYMLIVRDDGEGFDNQGILDRAIELDMLSSDQVSSVNLEHAFKLAFMPGFSKLSDANLDGGRGVGLDVVHTMVKEFNGVISVQHKPGLFCQFRITIPKV